jgi:hypothetical protein
MYELGEELVIETRKYSFKKNTSLDRMNNLIHNNVEIEILSSFLDWCQIS